MKKNMFLMLSVLLLAVPMMSHAETGQECASNCVESCSDGGNNKDDDLYMNCLNNCLAGCMDDDTGSPDVPPPTPVDTSIRFYDNSFRLFAEAGTKGDYDVEGSTATTTSPNKGGDGAACSENNECTSDVCEGGSCCTNYGDPCDEYSHCCGHQRCVNNICPE